MKKILILFLAMIFLCSCSSKNESIDVQSFEKEPKDTVAKQIIDVDESAEPVVVAEEKTVKSQITYPLDVNVARCLADEYFKQNSKNYVCSEVVLKHEEDIRFYIMDYNAESFIGEFQVELGSGKGQIFYYSDGNLEVDLSKLQNLTFELNNDINFATKEEYIKSLRRAYKAEDEINYVMSNADMTAISSNAYQLWDDELNRIYKLLKNKLSAADMEVLVQNELAWIKYRDSKIADAAAEWEGGSGQGLAMSSAACSATKERTLELIDYYFDGTTPKKY